MTANSKITVKRLDFLMSLPLFKDFEKKELEQIVSKMALTKYQKGEILALTRRGRSRLYIMT